MDDVVVRVIRADLAFELVDAKKNIISKLNNKQLKKNIPTTIQLYRVYHSLLQ